MVTPPPDAAGAARAADAAPAARAAGAADATRAAGARPAPPAPGAGTGAARARVAELQLRGRTGPLPAQVCWPARPAGSEAPGLLVLFPAGGSDDAAGRSRARALCARLGVVVLTVFPGPGSGSGSGSAHRATARVDDAVTVTQWAADHASELDADPDQLLVGGEGDGAELAAAVATHARDEGWPPVTLIPIDPGGGGATGHDASTAPGGGPR